MHRIKFQSRSQQSTSNPAAAVEITNIQKEFMLFQLNVENRLKLLGKAFRILKNRTVLKKVSQFCCFTICL